MRQPKQLLSTTGRYGLFVREIEGLLAEARRRAARSINAVLTATYWEIGRRIVEFEQAGEKRAHYGEAVIRKLSEDLTCRLGRGFSPDNLELMRRFYLVWPPETLKNRKSETPSRKLALVDLARALPLSWSHYARLLKIQNQQAITFYEIETLRGGWSVRQLDRQIESQFYERTMLSRNKAAMLVKGGHPQPQDAVLPEEEIKDPYVLEFLGLKDEYSESGLEDGLIRHLETFLLELGTDFAFVARQKRLRIGHEWYRVDLVFYHRRLRCLILIDLKIGRFTHADAGQMHLYLNYAREHWRHPDENPPVGLILCAQKDAAVARYALEGLSNKILAAEYRTTLPDERKLEDEVRRTQITLSARRAVGRLGKKKEEV